jgi:hypothetical protein
MIPQEADSLIAMVGVNVGAAKPSLWKMAPRRPPVSFLQYCYCFRVLPLQGKRATFCHVRGHLSGIDSRGLPRLLYSLLVPAHHQQGLSEVLMRYERERIQGQRPANLTKAVFASTLDKQKFNTECQVRFRVVWVQLDGTVEDSLRFLPRIFPFANPAQRGVGFRERCIEFQGFFSSVLRPLIGLKAGCKRAIRLEVYRQEGIGGPA